MSVRAKLEFDKVLKDMFREEQLNLPEEDRCGSGNCCFSESDGFRCTKDIGHSGDHIAHGTLGEVVKRWKP